MTYGRKGKLDTAIADFNLAIENNPKNWEAYLHRGTAYNFKKEFNKAIKDFNLVIKNDPENLNAYLSRGITYSNKGKLDIAIKDFNYVIEKDPKNSNAYSGRGTMYGRKGKFNKAIEDFNLAIENDPENWGAYLHRGITYLIKDKLDQAITDFNLVIKNDPENLNAYLHRGITYSNKGKLDTAITDFNLAIENDPKNSNAYSGRGMTYGRQGKLDQAITDFNLAIENDPENWGAYLNRGIAYYSKGNLDTAITDFKRVIKNDPKDERAYLLLGLSYSLNGLYNKAFDLFIYANKLNSTLKSHEVEVYISFRINDIVSKLSSHCRKEVVQKYFKLLKIINSIQKLLFYNQDQPGVAHYTSLNTLKKLVNKEYFRLYNAAYMNDPEEGRIFFDIIKGFLLKEEFVSKKKLLPKVKKYLEDLFYEITDEERYYFPAYIGSFVRLDSNEAIEKDKLFLWRTYGRDNSEEAAGSCLVFPRESFLKSYTPQIGHMRQQPEMGEGFGKQKTKKLPIYEVMYEKDMKACKGKALKNKLIKLCIALVECIEIITSKCIKKDEDRDELKNITFELLDGIRFLFKSDDYSEECELRFIQPYYHGKTENKAEETNEVKEDLEQTPPRFYMNAPEDFNFNEIILGPNARNVEDWKWWIKEQNPNIKVKQSIIKYGNSARRRTT